MVAHARRDAPNECCGLLVGGRGRVAFALPMANGDPRPRTGFRIDPAEHIAARRVLRRLVPALEIVGVYHSHPAGSAVPSDRDIKEAHYPDWVWVIVGAGGRSIRGFQIKHAAATTVPIAWT
jgi:proteasome lid subunit RPN8/RPN11